MPWSISYTLPLILTQLFYGMLNLAYVYKVLHISSGNLPRLVNLKEITQPNNVRFY